MSLTARQCRTLDGIEKQLRAREPRLASMFAIFTRLTKEETLPTVETVRVRRWQRLGELIARWRRQRRVATPTAIRVINVAVVPLVVLSGLVAGLLIGSHGSPPGQCRQIVGYHWLAMANIGTGTCNSALRQSTHSRSQ